MDEAQSSEVLQSPLDIWSKSHNKLFWTANWEPFKVRFSKSSSFSPLISGMPLGHYRLVRKHFLFERNEHFDECRILGLFFCKHFKKNDTFSWCEPISTSTLKIQCLAMNPIGVLFASITRFDSTCTRFVSLEMHFAKCFSQIVFTSSPVISSKISINEWRPAFLKHFRKAHNSVNECFQHLQMLYFMRSLVARKD